jgi:heat shock protein HspQ
MIRPADHPPSFQPGQLVRHRRYGYRGVVVDLDQDCKAAESWYQSNQTQPLRQQPWYHVLVHGTATVTYAAQENLELDTCREAIDHPLLDAFFSDFQNGCYVRNSRPWSGGC